MPIKVPDSPFCGGDWEESTQEEAFELVEEAPMYVWTPFATPSFESEYKPVYHGMEVSMHVPEQTVKFLIPDEFIVAGKLMDEEMADHIVDTVLDSVKHPILYYVKGLLSAG